MKGLEGGRPGDCPTPPQTRPAGKAANLMARNAVDSGWLHVNDIVRRSPREGRKPCWQIGDAIEPSGR